MDDKDNVFQFGSVKGGKDDEGIPENNYIVTDIEGEQFPATGFCIFTPHHVAIMTDQGKGAIPALLIPLTRLVSAELIEDDEDDLL